VYGEDGLVVETVREMAAKEEMAEWLEA